MKTVIPVEVIQRKVYLIRGKKVMLDSDLAALYGVPTKRLNETVRRNMDRFPDDFFFQLSENEEKNLRSQIATSSFPGQDRMPILRSQIVTSNGKHGGRRYPTMAFTEHGIAMLSSVLNSQRAVQVNISIVRTFVQLREMLADNERLARRLDELEGRYDGQFRVVFDAIRRIMAPPDPPKRRIGY